MRLFIRYSMLITVIIVSSTVYAGGPLYTANGKAYRYQSNIIQYKLDRGAFGIFTSAEARDLANASFKVWEEVATSTVAFLHTEADTLSVDVNGNNFLNFTTLDDFKFDGINPIIFDSDGAITDSLFVGLFALVCLVFESKERKVQTPLVIGALIVLTSITRFATPIWLAIALVDFLNGRRGRALFVSLLALIATIPTFLTQPSNSVLPREGQLTVIQKLIALPESFGKILFFEVAQLAVLDRLLLTLLALAFILSITTIRNESSLRFILVLLSVWAIGAINGSIGVNFRYQMPILIFCAWTVLDKTKRDKSVTA